MAYGLKTSSCDPLKEFQSTFSHLLICDQIKQQQQQQ